MKILLITLFVLTRCFICCGDDELPLVRLTTQNWAPYQCVTPSGVSGVAVERVRSILNKMNYRCTIEVLPWKRAQLVVEQNHADGFFSASQNNSRDKYATISSPIAEQNWMWYFHTGKVVDVTSDEFVTNTNIGVLTGSNMSTWLKTNGFDHVFESHNMDALVKRFSTGLLQCVLSNELVMSATLKRLNLSESDLISKLNRNKPLGVYFSKGFLQKHPGFLKEFNQFAAVYTRGE